MTSPWTSSSLDRVSGLVTTGDDFCVSDFISDAFNLMFLYDWCRLICFLVPMLFFNELILSRIFFNKFTFWILEERRLKVEINKKSEFYSRYSSF